MIYDVTSAVSSSVQLRVKCTNDLLYSKFHSVLCCLKFSVNVSSKK